MQGYIKERLSAYIGGTVNELTPEEAHALLKNQEEVTELYLQIRTKKNQFRKIVQEAKWRKERRQRTGRGNDGGHCSPLLCPSSPPLS